MADVFLSYAREDQSTASRIADAVTRRGWSVFWDRQIYAGPRFEDVISRELGSAKCMVVLWSSASVKSDWVLDEANEGKARGVLIQAVIEEVRAPFGFRQYQTASLVGWDGDPQHRGVHDLFSGIESMAARERQPQTVDAGVGAATDQTHAPIAVAPLQSAPKAPASTARKTLLAACAVLALLAVLSIPFLLPDRSQPGSQPPVSQGAQPVAPVDKQPLEELLTGGVQRDQSAETSAQREKLLSQTLATVLLPRDAEETYRKAVLAFRDADWQTAASLFRKAASFHDDAADLSVSIGPSDTMRYLPNLYAAQAFRRLMDCAGVQASLARLEATRVVEGNQEIRSDVGLLRLWCTASALK